jgi:hypothetical protein
MLADLELRNVSFQVKEVGKKEGGSRSKALDSGSSHEGFRGFEFHPSHLYLSTLALLHPLISAMRDGIIFHAILCDRIAQENGR